MLTQGRGLCLSVCWVYQYLPIRFVNVSRLIFCIMPKQKFSPQQAEKMYNSLVQIHDGLKDKNQNRNFMQIPFIEMAWMTEIEKYLPKGKQVISKHFKKTKNLFAVKK